jgi:hypothetical protein
MPSKTKDVDVVSVPVAVSTGMKAKKVELEAPEDEQEKALRLHKERYSFYAKELSVWALTPAFITTALVLCLWMIVGAGWSPAEKEWARTGFMAIVSGAVGVFFGKQMGK